jgi:hypothetical protein
MLISSSCSKNPNGEEETSDEPRVKCWPEKLKWKKGFDKVYRLEKGQVLKRIAPLFIPERYKFNEFHRSRIAPSSITFYWDGEIKSKHSGTFGEERKASTAFRQHFPPD